jgi:peptidoglycan/xylan/chitin deacetylase (PgdA/CDA1 family)
MNRLRLLAKAALCGLYKFSGAARLQEHLRRHTGPEFLAILLLHRVTDDIPEDGLTVSTDRFRRLCRMLGANFRVVPLADVFRLARARQPFPPRTVAITFDDCYRDNLFAARTLVEFGLPATFFVPTGFIGTDHVFAWDRDLPRMPNLTWDDLREMVRLGFEIGSHTVTHANFGRIGVEQAVSELVESKLTLEKRLDRPARWFAYPFGGVENLRPEFMSIIEEAGYEGCLSGYGGFVHGGADYRMLPREAVPYFHSLLNLELHLTGSLNWYYALKRRAGLMSDAPHRDSLRRALIQDATATVPLACAGLGGRL